MRPQPLNKKYRTNIEYQGLMLHHNAEVYLKEQIDAAVAWLKQEIIDVILDTETEDKINKIIDEAFGCKKQ